MSSPDPNLDNIKSQYNTFNLLPQASYNVVTYLMEHDDEIWRLLNNTSPDAWNPNKVSNLTTAQKAALVWDGSGKQTDHRVFFDLGQDESWTEVATVLRVSPVEIIPSNYVYGTMTIGFQIFTHSSIISMSNYATRNIFIVQRLLEVLNGADIEGIGRLYFDAKASSRCKISLIGQTTYKGIALAMCNSMLG